MNLLSSTSQSRRGFTLIELLVVVVIIGLLGALGFMSTRSVSDGATRARIAANMKQLVDTYHLFSSDYNGALMHAAETQVRGQKRTWAQHLLVVTNPHLEENRAFEGSAGDLIARSMGVFKKENFPGSGNTNPTTGKPYSNDEVNFFFLGRKDNLPAY